MSKLVVADYRVSGREPCNFGLGYAQRTADPDAKTVSVLMPWIVAPARRGTRRGSLQWQNSPTISRCGTNSGRPTERVLRDDEDPCTFYWPTTIEFAYPG